MPATIRPALPGDERNLAVLNAFVQELHVANEPAAFKPAPLDEVAAWFASLLREPINRLWIAEEGGRAVGYVLAILRERPDSPFCRARRWYELDQIAIDPAWRKRGVGRALAELVVADAARAGIGDVELSCWAFNEDAQQAFRRLGFVPKVVRFARAPA